MTENSVMTRFRRISLCRVTSGVISSVPPVACIAFGDGGCTPGGIPIPPVETQTALTHEIPDARYPIIPVAYPVDTTARYTAIIPEEDLPGAVINEAGLIDAAGNLVAIKTMYPKQKDEGVEFAFTFDDEF